MTLRRQTRWHERLSIVPATVGGMDSSPDLASVIWAAIAGLPAQAWAAFQASPVLWSVIGLAMLGVLALSFIGPRKHRRRTR